MNDKIKVLRDAADLIDNVGWVQFDYARDSDGVPTVPSAVDATCFCLHGALIRVGGCFSTAHDVLVHVSQQVRLEFGDAYEGRNLDGACIHAAITFNDAPKRTAPEVSDLLRRTAARLEAGTVLV